MPYREFTTEEERANRDFVQRFVQQCASELVGELAKVEAFALPDTDCTVWPLLGGEDWREPVADYILGLRKERDLAQLRDDLAEFEEYPTSEDVDELAAMLVEQLAALDVDDVDFRSFCDSRSIDAYAVEVFEHWLVQPWLGERLAEHGEIVHEFCGLTIWGRTTTGQSMVLDEVIREIARAYREARGESLDEWK